ncbi:MAG: O-antigen ligase family protein [Caulobacteraceae bacterium]
MSTEASSAKPTLAEGVDGAYPGWLLLGALALTPLLAYLGNLGFAPLTAIVGLACLPLLARDRSPSLGMAILCGLLAWGLISTAWSPVAPLAPNFHRYKEVEALTWLKLILQLPLYGAFVFAASRTSPTLARRSVLVLGVGMTILAVFLLIEGVDSAAVYQWIKAHVGDPTRPDLARRNVARACYVLVLLLWPAALMLWRCRLKSLTVAISMAVVVGPLLLDVDAPLAALLVSLAAFLLVRFAGQIGIYLLMAGTTLYFAFAPVLLTLVGGAIGGKASWGARQAIWRFVVDRIYEHPLRGWGLDASRSLPEPVPLHPHDGALQLWLELGVPGAVLSALFWAWMIWSLATVEARDRTLAAVGAATAFAYLTIGALSFGIWQEWWLALGALAAGVFALSNVSSAAHVHTRQAYYQ